MGTVAAGPGSVMVSIEYDGTGKAWARLYDNPILGWTIDETGASEPVPSVMGSLPLIPADTAPILSPQWVIFIDPAIFVPDLWRGSFPDFLTWLATNNGATRPLSARFAVSPSLLNGFNEWAQAHPELSFEGDPPEPPPPEA
jgi:hypothetical protein